MTNKEIAQSFLLDVAFGKVQSAYDAYVSDNFLHHNAYFKGDRQSLLLAMQQAHESHPNQSFEIQHAVQDADTVMIHSKVVPKGNPLGFAVVHIFKFKDHKIIELWDFGQAVPENCINENGMF